MRKITNAALVLVSIAILASALSLPTRIATESPGGDNQAQEDIDQSSRKAKNVDDYFKARKMPLAGHGKQFVEAADKHGIDYRLLAAIAVRESSGGKHIPPGSFNAFGWNSGDHKFASYEEAIEQITERLANSRYYRGKTTSQKLETYNPPSVAPNYAVEVTAIMTAIGD